MSIFSLFLSRSSGLTALFLSFPSFFGVEERVCESACVFIAIIIIVEKKEQVDQEEKDEQCEI